MERENPGPASSGATKRITLNKTGLSKAAGVVASQFHYGKETKPSQSEKRLFVLADVWSAITYMAKCFGDYY